MSAPDPQYSAEWLISRITEYQRSVGQPIPEEWLRIYRTPVHELTDAQREPARRAHNFGVDSIRATVTAEKRAGAPTMKVRMGLRLPLEWEHHYEVVFKSSFPWFFSGVMQSAFLGNPLAGERGKWRSP